MPIKITLTIEPSDLWGADEFYKDGGDRAIKEMAMEDLNAFIEEAKWKIEYTSRVYKP